MAGNAFDEQDMPPQGGGGPMPPMPPQGAPPQGAQPGLPPQLLEQIMQLMQGAQGAYDQTVPGPQMPPGMPQQEPEGDEGGHVCPMCGSKC